MTKLIIPLTLALSLTTVQVPICAQQEPETQEKNIKKKFAYLTNKSKKKLQTGLRLIEKGEINEEEDIDKASEGVNEIIKLGEATIPKILQSFNRMEPVGRISYLENALNSILENSDLHLAYELLGKKSAESAYLYVLKRWSASGRKDTEPMLLKHINSTNADIHYVCSTGLLLRGRKEAVGACISIIENKWKSHSKKIRADFYNSPRGLMNDKIQEHIQSKDKNKRLLGLHLFELFGEAKNSFLLRDGLRDSDTSIRLAAINACRVVIDNKPYLARPAMTQIIELAREWEKRL